MADRGEGALARWSRLKRESKAGQAKPSDDVAALPKGTAANDAALESRQTEDAEAVRLEDLPDINELSYESDFTVFLRKGVPDALRKAALRKLWASGPVFAIVDGLDDYNLDYTKPEKLSKSVQALIPEQADPAPLGPRHEVTPGRRGPKVPRKGEAQRQAEASDSPADERPAPESQTETGPAQAGLKSNGTSRQ